MTQSSNLEALIVAGEIGEACRRLATPLKAWLLDRAGLRHIPAHLVDDAVQETALRLLLHHRRFDPAKASAWTWVRTIADRVLIDLARRHRPGRPLYGADGKLMVDPIAPPAGPDPADAADVLRACLGGLNPVHREAVRLRLDGLDQKTVGAKLGLRPGNVAVILHKFRAKLRAMAE